MTAARQVTRRTLVESLNRGTTLENMAADEIMKLRDACSEMAEVIRNMELPEQAVRRMTSFEVAEFIYSRTPLTQ